MYYWSKLYSKGIKSGKDYPKLNKTISIMITRFEMKQLKEIEKFHTEWKIREKKYKKIVLTDVFELHIIELPKLEKIVKEKIPEEDKKLAIWSKFLLNPDSMGEKEMNENKDIKKAKEELEKMRQDEYEERIAELREKKIMDEKAIRAYGFDEGIEQGEKKALIKVAKKMLKSGIKIEDVIKITELTKEEIEEK